MTSQKQIEANRKNSLKSTGPNTPAGRAVVSQNAITHGLRAQQVVIEGEVQEEFNDFRNLLIARFAPADPFETLLVDRIAAGFWRLRRAEGIEAQIYNELRDTLLIEQKQNPDNSRLLALDMDKVDFPSRKRYKSFKEAKAAWAATEDGIGHAEGCRSNGPSPDNSFSISLEDSQVPDPQAPKTEMIDIHAAISSIRERNEGDPDFQRKLSEVEDILKGVPKVRIFPLHIPALRQYLQDIRQLIQTSEKLVEEYGPALDDAIEDISHIEASINQQLEPNLGRAVSVDLKGSDVLNKFVRYESHIERSTFKAWHELQRVQAMRQNQQLSAPTCLDIDISCI